MKCKNIIGVGTSYFDSRVKGYQCKSEISPIKTMVDNTGKSFRLFCCNKCGNLTMKYGVE